jgi:hypothetical protein
MTRSQVAALVALAVLFLIAVVILIVQIVWGSGGLQLDELPGSG